MLLSAPRGLREVFFLVVRNIDNEIAGWRESSDVDDKPAMTDQLGGESIN